MAGTHGVTSTTYSEQSQLVAQDGAIMKKATISGSDMVRGAVVERSGNKYIKLATAANAAGILAEDAEAAGADVKKLVFKAGYFRYSDLVWPTMSAADKKTALEALEDRNIIVDVDITEVEATS